MRFHTPEAVDLRSILHLLFSGIKVVDSKAGLISQDPVIGIFVDDAGQAVALVVCDVSLSVFMGAAMVMVPPPVAKEAAAAGELSGMVRDSLNEVMNILSRLFMAKDTAHLRHSRTCTRAELSDVEQAILSNPGKQVYFDVSIDRYGDGAIGFLAV